jgi:battenin
LTYLQLSTRYGRTGAGRGVAWFSSGTGAAGLVGSGAWWLVRPLGVKWGLFVLSFLPLLMGFAYSIALPSTDSVENELGVKAAYEPIQGEEYEVRDSEDISSASPERGPSMDEAAAVLAVSPHASMIDSDDSSRATQVKLTMNDKIQLIKPMLFVYIFPLVLVYFFE